MNTTLIQTSVTGWNYYNSHLPDLLELIPHHVVSSDKPEWFFKEYVSDYSAHSFKTADKLSIAIRIKTSDSVSWPAYVATNDPTPQHSSTHSLQIDTLLILYIISFFFF